MAPHTLSRCRSSYCHHADVDGPKDAVRAVAWSWIAARVAVVAGTLAAGLALAGNSAPHRLHLDQGPWTWDGSWYLQLMQGGWGSRGEGFRFFPLYPTLSEPLGWLFGDKAALLIVNNAAALACGAVMWVLARSLGHGRTQRSNGVWTLAIAPGAVALVWAYAEGVGLLAILVFLLADRALASAAASRPGSVDWRWTAVGVAAGFCAAAARPTGVLIAVVPAVELLSSMWRARGLRRTHWSLVALGAAPVAGLATVFAWVGAATGDPWLPLTIQRQLRAGFHEPISRVVRMCVDVASGDRRDAINLAAFAVIAVGLWLARRAIPVSWMAYGLIGAVVTFSANNVDSAMRYALLLVPVSIGWAQLASRSSTWRAAVLGCSAAAAVAYTTLAVTGTIVP